ncbi:MAG: Gfo/Idh/MocA family oxidoreductase [Acidobacteriota bacterium]
MTLALIGAGYWGKNLARNFNQLGVLSAICDQSPDVLQSYCGQEYAAVRKTTNIDEVLAEPAISRVAIATPASRHADLVKAALRAGKDVFVEKPLCLHVTEGEELVALAKSRGRILMVGHLLQYHPCILELHKLLANGDLGKLEYITSNRLNLGKIRREENALWSFAPHDLSVILSLTGNQLPSRVQCVGGAYLNNGIPDTTLTSMSFSAGVRAHVYVSWLNPFKEQKLTVVGSLGMVVFDDTSPWGEKLLLHRQPVTWTNGQFPTANKHGAEKLCVTGEEPLRQECLHFLSCCESRTTPKTDGEEGLRVLRLLEMAQQSLEKDGETVTPAAFAPARPSYFVHPTAVVDDGAEIGAGTKIWHFSHIMKGAKIGERCVFGQNVNVDGGVIIGNNVKVQNNVSIYSGLEIEDDVFLGPSCVLTNVSNPRSQVNRHSLYEKTVIKRGASIGANATIVCGLRIGRYAFIGAGAVVTKDVPDYVPMLGNPASRHGWMSRHGHRLMTDESGIMTCPESGFRYQEVSPGLLRCLDLDENSPLPEELRAGAKSYRSFKIHRTK